MGRDLGAEERLVSKSLQVDGQHLGQLDDGRKFDSVSKLFTFLATISGLDRDKIKRMAFNLRKTEE